MKTYSCRPLMSELLNKQVDAQNQNLKMKIMGFTHALVKCAMKIRNKKNNRHVRLGKTVIIRRLVRPGYCFYIK